MTTFVEAHAESEKVKAACRELELDGATTDLVMASYRFSPSFLHTILEHNGDHRAYVEAKLILRASMNGEPEPSFPPRLGSKG